MSIPSIKEGSPQEPDWPPQTFPSRLYRFVSVERAEQILKERLLFFCSPEDFNDPFDCKITPSFQASPRDFEVAGKLLAKQQKPNATRHELRSMVRHVRRRLNPTFFVDQFEDWRTRFINQSGMLCLTERKQDILMWSHYTNGHTGICLEFEIKFGEGLFGHALPIRYADEFPDFNFIPWCIDLLGATAAQKTDLHLEFGKQLLLTKGSHWSYEKEWRLIDFPSTGVPRHGIRNFQAELLTGIILGCRMSEARRRKIRDLAENFPSHPRIYQATPMNRRFELEVGLVS